MGILQTANSLLHYSQVYPHARHHHSGFMLRFYHPLVQLLCLYRGIAQACQRIIYIRLGDAWVDTHTYPRARGSCLLLRKTWRRAMRTKIGEGRSRGGGGRLEQGTWGDDGSENALFGSACDMMMMNFAFIYRSKQTRAQARCARVPTVSMTGRAF